MLENEPEVIALLQRCPNCGERGSMREKGIDGRHAEADSLGLGNQPGTTPFVNARAFLSTDVHGAPMPLLNFSLPNGPDVCCWDD
jgi:hypothetical protein